MECLLPLFCLAFLAHGCPYVCDYHIGVLGSLQRLVGHLELVAVLCRKVQDFLVRLIVVRAGDSYRHTHLQTAHNQRVCHVVAVADKAHLQAVKAALEFPDGHQIRQYLARVTEVRQTVDDRDRAVLCQIFHFFLLKGTDHDAVQIPGQYTCGILYRLASADLQIVCRQEQRMTAQLVHTGLKGNTGTGRSLLEDHAQRLALQMGMGNAVLQLIFQLIGKVQDLDDLFGAEIQHFQ